MWYGCSRTCSRSSAVSGPGFCQIARVDRHAAQVVDESRAPDRRHARRVDPAMPRRGACELGDAGRVAGEIRREEVGEVAHRRERAIERLPFQHERWGRLAGRAPRPTPTRSRRARGSPCPRLRGTQPPPGRRRAPARSRTRRTACSTPPSRRCKAASIATWVIRIGKGICSRSARRSGPLPSHRSVRWTRRPGTEAGAPTSCASMPATSQAALMAGRCSRAIFGSRRAV